MSAAGDQLQRRERHQPQRRAGRDQRGALGVEHRIRLRHGLGEHEEDEDVEHHTDDDARRAEQAGEHDPGEGGLHGLADVDREQQRVDPALGVLDEAQQGLARLLALVGQRGGLRLGHPRHAHLGDREEDQDEQQDEDDDEHQRVDVGELGGEHADHQSGCSWRKPAGAGPCQWWACEQLELPGAHRDALVLLGVVVAEHVEHAVDDEQGELVVDRPGVVGRLAARRPSGRARRRRAGSACHRGRAGRGRDRGSATGTTGRRRPARRRSGTRGRRSARSCSCTAR